MKHVFKSAGGLLALVAGLSALLPAQTAAEAGPAIEPEAMEALNKMGAYLRTLKAFQVNTKGTNEVVLTDGQKVQYGQRTTLLSRVPDRLRAEVEGDRGATFYLFDGKNFTLFARDDGYYATVPAPSNLRQLIENMDDKYDVEIPLADLFLWGARDNPPPKLTGAIDLGASDIEGITCEHYAFRTEGLDFQVWIQRGEFPLPRKYVLTTTTDEARPQNEVVLDWNLAPSYNEAAFTFIPPEGARKIVFAGLSASGKK